MCSFRIDTSRLRVSEIISSGKIYMAFLKTSGTQIFPHQTSRHFFLGERNYLHWPFTVYYGYQYSSLPPYMYAGKNICDHGHILFFPGQIEMQQNRFPVNIHFFKKK